MSFSYPTVREIRAMLQQWAREHNAKVVDMGHINNHRHYKLVDRDTGETVSRLRTLSGWRDEWVNSGWELFN